jgi:hypothetical protein
MQLGICCSPLHHQLALRLANRFERNLGITTVIVADEQAPLMEIWEQASASDAVLLMLDQKSAPGPLKRDDWQSLLDHTGVPPVAILKLESCSYPKLLERSRFFAPDGSQLEAARWVERWLVSLKSKGMASSKIHRPLNSVASVAGWWTKAVDSPGVLALDPEDIDAVQTFASDAGSHFENVVWLGCGGVPAEALKAEIEFRCEVSEEQNSGGRLLFVLIHVGPDFAIPPSCAGEKQRHSFVIVAGPSQSTRRGGNFAETAISACRQSGFPGVLLDSMLGPERRHEWEPLLVPLTADRRWFRPRSAMDPSRDASQLHLETLQQLFRGWRRQPELCRELASEAAWAIHRNPPASSELTLDLALFLLAEKRKAEAVVWLRMLASSADEEDEFAIQAREELRWLVDEFGSYRRLQPIVPGEQVTFDFPGFFMDENPADESERLLLQELQAEIEDQLRHTASAPSRSMARQLQFDSFS